MREAPDEERMEHLLVGLFRLPVHRQHLQHAERGAGMTAGMAAIIAAHAEIEWDMETGRAFCECGAALGPLSAPTVAQHRKLYRHAARELAKAGYGMVQAETAEHD